MAWTCRLDGKKEDLIQQFSKKIYGMSYVGITFKQFSIWLAAYSIFSPAKYS
jgi:hypothetical protein